MKKSLKPKSSSIPAQAQPDIPGFMANIQNQLLALARKVDALLGGAPEEAVETKVLSEPDRRPDQPQRPSEMKQGRGRGRGERVLHKAVCADCHKDCEVPFKPSGERPVYCKECFAARKSAARSGKPHGGHRQGGPVPPKEPAVNINAAPALPERRVIVTKKGVGRVTISEVARPSSAAPSQARPRPARQSPRGPREIPGKKKR